MILIVLAALLQSAPATPAPTPQPPAQATPVPATSPPPTPPAPSLTPTAAPTATPGLYGYVLNFPPPAAPTSGPVITQVSINDRTIHAGGPLMVQVTTSTNVVGVEARCWGRFIAIPQVGPGVFALSYTMPTAIPFIFYRSFDIVIAAATPDGQQTTKDLSLTLAH
jgi:hypothetical protein